MPKYSLVIPVYNEEKILQQTIETVHEYLTHKKYCFELIIANDGSIDNSPSIIRQLQKKYSSLILVENKKNRGRGSVLTSAFYAATGDIILYIDADLAVDYHLFEKLSHVLSEGYDIAVCSKHLPESEVEYPKIRRVASKCYSWLICFLFEVGICDYQCGFKAFRKEVIQKILSTVESEGWSWDTEILIRSHLAGYKIKEIPAKVVNIYQRESTVHLLKDSLEMGMFAWKLFWKVKRSRRLER